jgi:hypothetical protein
MVIAAPSVLNYAKLVPIMKDVQLAKLTQEIESMNVIVVLATTSL